MWHGEDAIRELSRQGPWRHSRVSGEARRALNMEYTHRADAQFMLGVAATARVPAIRLRRQRRLVRAGKWTLGIGERVLRTIFAGRSVP